MRPCVPFRVFRFRKLNIKAFDLYVNCLVDVEIEINNMMNINLTQDILIFFRAEAMDDSLTSSLPLFLRFEPDILDFKQRYALKLF